MGGKKQERKGRRKAGRMEGMKEGWMGGRKEGRKAGRLEGMKEGRMAGSKEGRDGMQARFSLWILLVLFALFSLWKEVGVLGGVTGGRQAVLGELHFSHVSLI